MMFVGETLDAIGMTAEANAAFQQILDRAKSDKGFAKASDRAMVRVRTQLVRGLREQGKFSEALDQVDQLLKENPNSLEPLVEKGKILQAWAEKDSAKFDDAVTQWTTVRNRLQAFREKPKEYYDANYNVALCLVRMAEKSKNSAIALDRSKKAEQVLKAILILNPSMDGPDRVAQYKALLDKAIRLQGRSPEVSDAAKAERQP
jgi:tetratricopeptide (TPR) repeat protein